MYNIFKEKKHNINYTMPKKNTNQKAKATKEVSKETPKKTSKKSKKETKETMETQQVPEPVVETTPVVEETKTETTENTEEDFNMTTQFADFTTRLAEWNMLGKTLLRDFKTLERQHRQVVRQLSKQTRRRTRTQNGEPRKPSGFAKPTQISAQLAKFVGKPVDTLMSRTDVTKEITKYIREHNLQDSENHRHIKPDAKLKKLLGPLDPAHKNKSGESDVDTGYTYFNLQRYLKHHYPASQATTTA